MAADDDQTPPAGGQRAYHLVCYDGIEREPTTFPTVRKATARASEHLCGMRHYVTRPDGTLVWTDVKRAAARQGDPDATA